MKWSEILTNLQYLFYTHCDRYMMLMHGGVQGLFPNSYLKVFTVGENGQVSESIVPQVELLQVT